MSPIPIRFAKSLTFVLLAGCASTATSPAPSPLDGEAFGGEPAVPALVAPPSPEPAPPLAFDTAPERDKDRWEFVLGGFGASDQDVSNGSASLAGSLGMMVGDHFQLVVRQNTSFLDTDATGSITQNSTRLAGDILFGSGSFQPFIGANVGYVYGDLSSDTWEAAPEAGIKLFLRDHVFLQLMAEYQFFFDDADQADEAFEDGSLVYSLGLGMTF